MDNLIKSATDALASGMEHTKDAIQGAVDLLSEEVDIMGSMVGLSEKLNMSWRRRWQLQGDLNKELQKTHSEELEVQAKIRANNGVVQKEDKENLDSILQRRKALEHEIGVLRVLNLSGVAPLIILSREAWKLFAASDKAITSLNMHMGLTRESSRFIKKDANDIAIQYMNIGVTFEGIYHSIQALAVVFGSIYTVTKELATTTAILKSQLGVSEENSAGFFKNMAAISGTTMTSQKNMAYMAAMMSNAAGTNLNQVMGDIASKSSNTLMMMSRIPSIAIKSAIEFRRLGTSLDEVANASKHILNFSSNIQEEMEASVLLGHSINLQKARELAYHKDLEGSNREILRLAQQNRFMQLDPFQQEAFAAATGRSVGELLNMVQAENEWNDAKYNGSDAVKAQIAQYEKLKKSNSDILSNKTKQFELSLLEKSNQERTVAVQQKWNQLLAQVNQYLLRMIDGILSIVPAIIPILPVFAGVYKILRDIEMIGGSIYAMFRGIGLIALISGKTVDGVVMLLKLPKLIGSMLAVPIMFSKIGKFVTSIMSLISSFGKFGAMLGAAGNAIPVLGEIFMIVQFIYRLWKRWEEGPKTFVGGLTAVFGALKDVLIQPFIDAWNWISSLWSGHSPSKLGLSIVTGIRSVGAMLSDALTYPFRHAFAWILDHIPGMSKFSTGLREGFGGLATTVNHKIENSNGITSNPQKTPEQLTTATQETSTNTEKQTNQNDDTNKLLQGVLNAINNLNSSLQNGAIAVNLDGQKVSTYLGRSIQFSGGYGTNR